MTFSIETITSQLERIVNTKTVVGEPIVVGNVTLIPVQVATFGFGSAGGEDNDKSKTKGGAGGGGVRLQPIAVIAVVGDDVQVYNLGQKGMLENLAKSLPEIITNFRSKKIAKESKGPKEGEKVNSE